MFISSYKRTLLMLLMFKSIYIIITVLSTTAPWAHFHHHHCYKDWSQHCSWEVCCSFVHHCDRISEKLHKKRPCIYLRLMGSECPVHGSEAWLECVVCKATGPLGSEGREKESDGPSKPMTSFHLAPPPESFTGFKQQLKPDC